MVFEEPREEVIYFSSHIQNIPHPAWKQAADKNAECAGHSKFREISQLLHNSLALRVVKLKAFEVVVLNIPPWKPGLNARKQRLTQTKGFAEQFRA